MESILLSFPPLFSMNKLNSYVEYKQAMPIQIGSKWKIHMCKVKRTIDDSEQASKQTHFQLH